MELGDKPSPVAHTGANVVTVRYIPEAARGEAIQVCVEILHEQLTPTAPAGRSGRKKLRGRPLFVHRPPCLLSWPFLRLTSPLTQSARFRTLSVEQLVMRHVA